MSDRVVAVGRFGGGLLKLALLCALPSPAHAQDDLERVQQLYESCASLLDEDPCTARKICERALAIQPLQAIVDLTDKARARCPPQPSPRKRTCEGGRIRTPETQGACCWPGQSWSEPKGACVGIPTECPPELAINRTLESCEIPCDNPEIEDGVLTNGHCCWPDQIWSFKQNQCIGRPSCPRAFSEKRGEPGRADICVPTDTDLDHIDDRTDLCPTQIEDIDGFNDLDGCPEYDNDLDQLCDPWTPAIALPSLNGLCAGSDLCPNEPEDPDNLQDLDGCPETDADNDGLDDTADACPQTAGVINGTLGRGCPTEPPPPPQPPSGPHTALAGWITLGVGGALAATSLGLYLGAESLRSDILNVDVVDGVAQISQANALAKQTRADNLDTAAVTTLSISGAAITASIVLLLLDDSKHRDSTTAHFSPILDADHWLLGFNGRF